MIDLSAIKNPITFLISYDEIIRDPNLFIINRLRTKLMNQMKNYIDMTKILNMSQESLQKELLIRTDKNILEWLSIINFDFEANYNVLYNRYKNMYSGVPSLKMIYTIYNLMGQQFVKEIFIYSKVFDDRKLLDINNLFSLNKNVTYVTGNYLDVVDKLGKVDVFVDNDIDRISPLFIDTSHRNKLFLLANYGYNYEMVDRKIALKNGTQEMIMKNKIQLTEFTPMVISKESFYKG